MLESLGVVDLWLYTMGAFFIILAPGPNSLYLLKTSASSGRAAGAACLAAIVLGDAVLIALSYFGVAALIEAHPQIFTGVKTAGGLYLGRIGARALLSTWRPKAAKPSEAGEAQHPGAAEEQPEAAEQKHVVWHAFRTATLLSLTNRS